MVKPEHVGEPLVRALLERISRADRLSALADGLLLGAETFVTNERLAHREGRLLDGEHRLDVVALWPDKAVALEVKLGVSLRGAAFERRYFKKPGVTAHATPRVCGSVAGLLDAGVVTLADSSRVLASTWVLVVRESVAATLRSRALACRLVTLEDLVGLAGGAAVVDEVMRELLPRSFAEAWRLG